MPPARSRWTWPPWAPAAASTCSGPPCRTAASFVSRSSTSPDGTAALLAWPCRPGRPTWLLVAMGRAREASATEETRTPTRLVDLEAVHAQARRLEFLDVTRSRRL